MAADGTMVRGLGEPQTERRARMKESCDTQKKQIRQDQDKDEEIPMLTEKDIRRLDERWEGIPLDQPLKVEDARRVYAN